ncbi:MAG: helix-turn-helix transcriptional regulator [Acidimicrobiia bacterium]|nr:helix-turn-helix transcriptional regulator [Acidimicrobiia bacterium]
MSLTLSASWTRDTRASSIDDRRYLAARIDACQYGSVGRKSVAVVDTVECCPSVLAAPLDAAEADELARGFAALADPARLRLLSLIAAQEAGEVCACDLVEPLGKSQPTVSHHLKVLYEAGLVDRAKRGTWVWYSVVPERVSALRSALSPTA